MIYFSAASVGLLLTISQRKHLSSEPEVVAVTPYEGILGSLSSLNVTKGIISSPNLKIGPTKIGYHQKMNEKYPQTENLN